ncbi:MAG: M16 family metallopeptidase [bacterium]
MIKKSFYLSFLIITKLALSLPLYRDSLDNGFIILTYEDHRLPMVDISFVCRSGAAFDPTEKAGIASMCAQMLLRGTKTLTADSLASILEFLGARYYSSTDFDHSNISLRLLAKDFAPGLDILTDMVLNPAFPKTEFDLVRDQALVSARRAYDYPQSLVGIEFDRLLFNRHRYALPIRGDTNTIPKITIEDLRCFHQTNFVPNNCFIVVVGAIKHEQAKQEIAKRLFNWQTAHVPEPVQPDLKLPEKTMVKLITRPDMNQSYIQLGHPGISAFDPDLIPVRLMSYILGGPPLSSRMGLAVREYAGLAYDVRCWFDRRSLTGAFRATVQTAKPQDVIEKMFAEIRKMHEHGANPLELLKAHNYFTGSFPLTFSSNQGKLEQAINLELYRYGTDWLENFPKMVRATTLEQINRAAKERLKPGHYLMVIMGNVTKEKLNLQDVEWIE